MAQVREIPLPHALDIDQPQRLRFGELDRIIIDRTDWTWIESTDDGYLLQTVSKPRITRAFSIAEMWAESKRLDFRHDHGWYAKNAVKARQHAAVSSFEELDDKTRERVLLKVDYIVEFLKLEKIDATVTRGDKPLAAAITRIRKILMERDAEAVAAGKKRRFGQEEPTFPLAPGIRRFLEWVKVLVEADFEPLALCPRYFKSGNHEERLTEQQCYYADKYTKLYIDPKKPSVRQLHERMETEIQQANLQRKKAGKDPIKPVSYDRLNRQVGMLDPFQVMAGREGMEAAVKHFRTVGPGLWDVLRPLQHIEMDHWTVNLQTLLLWSGQWHKLSKASQKVVRKHARRMTLGVAKCRRTHCIAGMILSRTASVDSTVRLLEMVVTEKKKFATGVGARTPYDIAGTPELAVMDGGPALNNRTFRGKLAGLKIDFEIPPGGLPHLRGTVERMFRTFDQKVISMFEGRTFPNIVEKGSYDSVGRAGITVDELGYILLRYVIDCYHNTPQSALGGHTPRSCYLELTKKHGVRACPDSHTRRNVFGVDIERALTVKGIRFLGIQYRSGELHKRFKKLKTVNARVYHGNLGAISVRIGRSLLTVKAPPEFEGVDVQTWIGAEALLRRRGAHYKKITREIVLGAIADFQRLAAGGRKRADISDVPYTKGAMLHAERSMKISANYPDEVDDTPEFDGDLYDGAIKVGTPAARKAAVSKRNRARKPAPAPKAPPKTSPKPARKPARASAKAPAAKKRPTAPTRIPGRRRVSGRGVKVTG